MTATAADLAWLGGLPGRCPKCFYHVEAMGHRSKLADGTPTGCGDSGPIWLLEQSRLGARAEVEADTSDEEWSVFVKALRADAAAHGGLVSQNRVREAIGHRWASTPARRRYSQMWSRARRAGLLAETGRTEQSTDRAGGNAHRQVPVLRMADAA